MLDSYPVGSRVIYKCDNNKKMPERRCQIDGSWTGVIAPRCSEFPAGDKCPMPDQPLNGFVNLTQNGLSNGIGSSVAIYTCTHGYTLSPSPDHPNVEVHCSNGQWDAKAPVCQRVTV